MKIWLDADGCPNDVKDCVFKASLRTETPIILVADRWVKLPPHPHLQMIVVNSGFNAADDYIADNATPQDLVVTDDIPLAHRCVTQNITTLSRRGQEFNSGNIGERLATRDLMEGLRNSGMITGGPSAYNANDKKKFAETFDRLLTRLIAKSKTAVKALVLMGVFTASKADAQSTLKASAILGDSESSQLVLTRPVAELGLKPPVRSAWSAQTAIKVPLDADDNVAPPSLKEARVDLELSHARISVGRLLLRPHSSGINESAKAFLRRELATDGLQSTVTSGNTPWSLFLGGPKVAGFSIAHNADTTRWSFIYRGERDQVHTVPELSPDGLLTLSPRAAHTHEAELSLQVQSEAFQLEGLFQTKSQGEQRILNERNDVWDAYSQGPTDRNLPKSSSEYRAAAQGRFLIDETQQSKDWIVVSWLSRTAPRLHDGTEDQKFFRQGGGNETQLTFALETVNPLFFASLGISSEYSPRAKYRYFSKRNDDGSRTLVKAKGQLWISTKIGF